MSGNAKATGCRKPGKSTTGQRLYRALRLNGYSAEFYHEFCRPHPILGIEADSISDWIERSVTAWRGFIHRLSERNSIAVVDGAFFQCGVGELLELDADDRTVLDYVQGIAELVKPVGAVMIHLFQRDIEAALGKIFDQRPEAWRRRVSAAFSDKTRS